MSSDPTPTSSDEDLVRKIREGDRAALDDLTARYWQPIWRFCHSYLSDEGLAEDVAQETFAKLGGGDLPEGQVKPWLYKVARNRCLDILRRHQRSPTHNHPIRTGFDPAKSTAGPHTRAAREERAQLLRDIIAQMPEEYRSVLTLKHIEGLSRSEIAATLEITEASVKGRLVRASDYLREQLEKISGAQP